MTKHEASRFQGALSLRSAIAGLSAALCMVCAFALSSPVAKAQACPNAATPCNSVDITNCTNYPISFTIVYCNGSGTPVVSPVMQIDAEKCDPATNFQVNGQIIRIELDGATPPVHLHFDTNACTAHISM